MTRRRYRVFRIRLTRRKELVIRVRWPGWEEWADIVLLETVLVLRWTAIGVFVYGLRVGELRWLGLGVLLGVAALYALLLGLLAAFLAVAWWFYGGRG